MRTAVVLGLVVAIAGCSSGSGGAKKKKCTDVASCSAGCEACRKGECKESEGRACFYLGDLHRKGQPPQFDLPLAASAFEAGCNGYAPACAALALQVQDGRGVQYDADRAKALYLRACDHGSGVGCFNVGVMYEGGVGVPQDHAKARELFTRAELLYIGECEADPLWCSNLGYLYENGMVGSGVDAARAAKVYTAACARGEQGCCVSLASLQAEGNGMPADRPAAIARLEAACAAGSGLGCAGLVAATDPKLEDPKRAVGLLGTACDDGDAHACSQLGALHALGKGVVAVDTARADVLFERACSLGNGNACMIRAEALRPVDPGRAAGFYEIACHIALPDACMAYAKLIATGAIPGTRDDARTWLEQACRQGSQDACSILRGP